MRSKRFDPFSVSLSIGLGSALLLAGVPEGRAQSTGASIPVTRCYDSGPGSLRAAVAAAVSGDTIDMRGLTCGRITLTRGAILAPQTDLTVLGPGRSFRVHGGNVSQVLRHTGTGLLRIQSLSLAHGRHVASVAQGGCLYSAGRLELRNVQVHDCVARAVAGAPGGNVAHGGGVFAAGDVGLYSSAVFSNRAEYNFGQDGGASGGGLQAGGRFTVVRSDIVQNFSAGNGGGTFAASINARYSNFSGNSARGDGGGVMLGGPRANVDNILANSTVARNHALNVGGAYIDRGTTFVINSTISENVADRTIGGLLVSNMGTSGRASVINSTIVYNRQNPFNSECGALYWDGDEIHLESSIVARNMCNDRPGDIDVDYHYSPSIVGANNLVGSSTVALPPDTIRTDPRLAPLADNGGGTRTHALLADSPAIERGNNTAGLSYDQRGAGFPRVKGAAADIGSFER